jgi:hypothetical protein
MYNIFDRIYEYCDKDTQINALNDMMRSFSDTPQCLEGFNAVPFRKSDKNKMMDIFISVKTDIMNTRAINPSIELMSTSPSALSDAEQFIKRLSDEVYESDEYNRWNSDPLKLHDQVKQDQVSGITLFSYPGGVNFRGDFTFTVNRSRGYISITYGTPSKTKVIYGYYPVM